MKIRKAVFPVAGLGTRVLPATKAMPKEMLTIVDKPLIQYVVDEAKEAGIEHFVFVTGRNKGVIEDHFDRMFELDTTLAARGKEGRAGNPGARPARSRRHELYPAAGAARPRPRGVVRARHRRRRAVRGGAAGRTGAEHAGLPGADDRGRQQARRQIQPDRGRSGARRISPINTASAASASATPGNMFEVDGMVEKPPKGTAPSNLSITGRYILQPEIFKILETQERGAGGEIQLTDAMIGLAENAKLLRRGVRGRAARLRLEAGLPARQHRLRHGARRFARRPARGDEEVSGEVKACVARLHHADARCAPDDDSGDVVWISRSIRAMSRHSTLRLKPPATAAACWRPRDWLRPPALAA